MHTSKRSAGRSFLVLLALALLSGCGSDRYPVSGRVQYEDGTPLEEGTIAGEMGEGEGKVMAQGNVRPDGTFEWGTLRPGDGARPGKYRVVILPRALGDTEMAQGMQPAVDGKFTRPESSGIVFEVKAESNEFTVTVTRPAPRSKR